MFPEDRAEAGIFSEADRHRKIIDECQHAITETKAIPVRRDICTKAISRILVEVDDLEAKQVAQTKIHNALVKEKRDKLVKMYADSFKLEGWSKWQLRYTAVWLLQASQK